MELKDIDDMSTAKGQYLKARKVLEDVATHGVRHVTLTSGESYSDAALTAILHPIVLDYVKRVHDDAKTRLMMFGVDKFPD